MKDKRRMSRKGRVIIATLVWIAAFALVNYPIGAWAGQKLYPMILGVPFSVFYFWAAYAVLIAVNVVIAKTIWRD